jgi:hypothetical protein
MSDSPDSYAKKTVRIDIEYRRAVLAIAMGSETESGKTTAEGRWWLVDRQGVLLPPTDKKPRLPILITEVAAPAVSPGSHWGDARVKAAARTAGFLQAQLARLHLAESEMEMVESEIVLRRPGLRIVWGHAPGQEKEDEAPANVKMNRLLDYQKRHGGLESLEHDVRLLAYQGHFPLSPDETPKAVSLYEPKPVSSRNTREHVSNSSRSWRSCFNEAKPAPANPSPP